MSDTGTGIGARLRRWLMPSYAEPALFLTAVTCLLLLASDASLRQQLGGLFTAGRYSDEGVGELLMWAGVVGGGLALSLFHAFSSRPKSGMEKTLMAAFAMAVNGIAGVRCGVEVLGSAHGWQAIFPIWNISSSLLLLYQIGLIEDDAVTDDNAMLMEIAVGTLVLAMLFAYCRFVAGFTWAMTLSVCVAYATSVDRILRQLSRLLKARMFAGSGTHDRSKYSAATRRVR